MIAITCCVNYADFLAATWPHNSAYFDRLIVITCPFDNATIRYCAANGIRCILSMAYLKDGSTFNRAAMLNVALDYLKSIEYDGWIASIDVDVIVDAVHCDNITLIMDRPGERKTPIIAQWCDRATWGQTYFFNDTWSCLKRPKQYIYGCPRKMIAEPHPDGIDHYRKMDVGAWFDYPYNLSAYLGYFQLFHSSTGARNDESYKTVDNSDTAFVDRNFGINNCRTLSDIVCYHLGENGVNWTGRKSKEWK